MFNNWSKRVIEKKYLKNQRYRKFHSDIKRSHYEGSEDGKEKYMAYFRTSNFAHKKI